MRLVEGSRWIHHSGREYTVLHIANIADLNSKYPISVVYQGDNGNVWVKELNNFYMTMKLKGE